MKRFKLLPFLLVYAFCCCAVAKPPGHAAAQKEDPEVFTRCRGGAGAYYQMFTEERDFTGRSYTYISADVYVGGGDAESIKITDPSKEVAFVFLGGNGTDGWWLDAGLQYSPLVKDWSLFFWDKGKALEVRGKPFAFERKATPTLTPQSRFAPDQTIKLELFVPQKAVLGARTPLDNRVAAIARGRQRDRDGVRGKAQVQRYVFEVPEWLAEEREGGRARYQSALHRQPCPSRQGRPNDGFLFQGNAGYERLCGLELRHQKAAETERYGEPLPFAQQSNCAVTKRRYQH